MNISETSWPITIKFYLNHHLGGEKAALGFGVDQIRTLVSMATDSSHRVIMGKRASSRFPAVFGRILFILAGNYDKHNSLKSGRIRPRKTELAAPERRKKSHRLIMGKTTSSHFLGCF